MIEKVSKIFLYSCIFVLLLWCGLFLAPSVSAWVTDCGEAQGYFCDNRNQWNAPGNCQDPYLGGCNFQWGTEYFNGVCPVGSPYAGQACYSNSRSCCMPGQGGCQCQGGTCSPDLDPDYGRSCTPLPPGYFHQSCDLGSLCSGTGGSGCGFCETPPGPACEPDNGICLPWGSSCSGWDDSFSCGTGQRCCTAGAPTPTPTIPGPTATPRPQCPFSCMNGGTCTSNGGVCRNGYQCQTGCCCDFGGGPTDTPTPTPPLGLSPTPTRIPTAVPGAPTVTLLQPCINPNAGGNVIQISWTRNNVTFVDISTVPNFATLSNKAVSGVFNTNAPTGFSGNLLLEPNIVYYTRTFAGTASPAVSFVIPLCPQTPTPGTYRISGRYINIGLSPTPGPGLCGNAIGTSTSLNGYQVNLYNTGRSTFTESYPDAQSPGAFLFYNTPNGTYSIDGEIPNGLRYICAYSPTTPGGSTRGPRPTIVVNGANVPGVKYVFGMATPTPADPNPFGNHDGPITCTSTYGWACDLSRPSQSLRVDIYDGPGFVDYIGSVMATGTRNDLGGACNFTYNHGFTFPIPAGIKDGNNHSLYAYAIGIDANGNPNNHNPVLWSSPRTINCAPPSNTIPPPPPTTPTPIPPGPWEKIINGSFQTQTGSFYSSVPDNPLAYDQTGDDPTHPYFLDAVDGTIGSGVVSGDTIIPQNKISYPQWSAKNYAFTPQFDASRFFTYVTSRKTYTTLSVLHPDLSDITKSGIYYYTGGDTTITSTDGVPAGINFVLIVKSPTKITIAPSQSSTDFNVTGDVPTDSMAIIAKTINFDANITRAYGIFFANEVDTGQSAFGLKIKGNLIVTDPGKFTFRRARGNNNAPSLFIVNYPQTYIDLLPYISTSVYDWKEKQVNIGNNQ